MTSLQDTATAETAIARGHQQEMAIGEIDHLEEATHIGLEMITDEMTAEMTTDEMIGKTIEKTTTTNETGVHDETVSGIQTL